MQQVAQSQAIPQVEVPGHVKGSRGGDTALWYAVPTSLFLGFILLPLAALVWRAVLDPTLWASLTKPMVLDALWVTGLTASATLLLALLVGTPLAYVLARRQFPGKWLVETVTDLPLVLPPVTAGVALLMAFGRRGTLGPSLSVLGIELPFTMTAVVLAQFFVAGSFYIRGAKLGFAAVNPGGRGSRGDGWGLGLGKLLVRDPSAGMARDHQWHRPLPGAGRVGVRGHPDVRREFYRAHADDVLSHYGGVGDGLVCSPGPGGDVGRDRRGRAGLSRVLWPWVDR